MALAATGLLSVLAVVGTLWHGGGPLEMQTGFKISGSEEFLRLFLHKGEGAKEQTEAQTEVQKTGLQTGFKLTGSEASFFRDVPPSSEPSKQGEGAFVCITGQIQRLELKAKINKVIVPLKAKFGKVTVALVMATGDAYFVNAGAHGHKPTGPSPFTRDLAEKYMRAAGVGEVIWAEVMPKEHPYVNQNLVEQQNINQGDLFTAVAARVGREENHARQYETLQSCYTASDLHKGWEPDIIVRMRDDTIPTTIDLDQVQTLLDGQPAEGQIERPKQPVIVTPACANWSGMSDKIAFLRSEAAESYFNAPAQMYPLDPGPKKLQNPEMYYQHTYAQSGVNVQATDAIQAITCRYEQVGDCVRLRPHVVASCERLQAKADPYLIEISKSKCSSSLNS